MAPEITWFDLNESLAPEGVVRTEWALALSAAATASDSLPPNVYKALVEGTATGQWPDGSTPGTENMVEFFKKNGPKWHVGQGRRLDIPMLFGQGTTDSLFNLQQGLANWQHSLTAAARKESIFVAYNGGHVLPSVLPAGRHGQLRPVQREARGRLLLRPRRPVHERAAQGPRHRPHRLRPLPPRHPGQHLHDGRLGRGRRDVRRRHGRHDRGRVGADRLPGRGGTDPDRGIAVPHRAR